MDETAILIFTPIDYNYKDADTHYAPSLGLVSIENYLYHHQVIICIVKNGICMKWNISYY